jgi:hypothetical protein
MSFPPGIELKLIIPGPGSKSTVPQKVPAIQMFPEPSIVTGPPSGLMGPPNEFAQSQFGAWEKAFIEKTIVIKKNNIFFSVPGILLLCITLILGRIFFFKTSSDLTQK